VKAAFNGYVDRFIWLYWVHCARCTLQDNKNAGAPKNRSYPVKCPSSGPYLQIWS